MKKRRLDVLDANGKVIASAVLWCEDGADFCKVMNYAYWPKSITANLVDCEEMASKTTAEIKEDRERIANAFSECIAEPELSMILSVIHGSPGFFRISVAESVASAVKKERARCAEIVRDFGRPHHDTNCCCAVCEGCQRNPIAAMIESEK